MPPFRLSACDTEAPHRRQDDDSVEVETLRAIVPEELRSNLAAGNRVSRFHRRAKLIEVEAVDPMRLFEMDFGAGVLALLPAIAQVEQHAVGKAVILQRVGGIPPTTEIMFRPRSPIDVGCGRLVAAWLLEDPDQRR